MCSLQVVYLEIYARLMHCRLQCRSADVCTAMPPCCAALQVFVELGLITAAEMEEAIVSEFNPVRWGSIHAAGRRCLQQSMGH